MYELDPHLKKKKKKKGCAFIMPELERWRQEGPWSFPVTQDMDSVPKDDT